MLIKRRNRIGRSFWLSKDGAGDGSADTDLGGGGGSGTDAQDNAGGDVPDDSSVDVRTSLAPEHVEVDIESAHEQAADERPQVEWGKLIPDEFKEKGYIQNILKADDPGKQLFQEFDGLQKKLGERAENAIPKADAPKEDWDKFHKAMGRPDTPDEYEIGKTEWGEEDKDIGAFIDSFKGNGEYEKDVKSMFYEEGLSKEAAARIAAKHDQILVKHNRGFYEQAAQANQEYEKDYNEKMTELFGYKRKERFC